MTMPTAQLMCIYKMHSTGMSDVQFDRFPEMTCKRFYCGKGNEINVGGGFFPFSC